MRNLRKKFVAVAVAAAMVFTSGVLPSNQAQAAGKLKLSKSSVSLKVGTSKKITIKNAPKGAKKTWASKNKKIAAVTKQGKITGKKAGKTKVICTVKYKKNKKKVTKKLTVAVTVKKKSNVTPTTQEPVASTGAAVTVAPTASAISADPTVSAEPAVSAGPSLKPANVATGEDAKNPNLSNLTTEHQSANGISTKDNGVMRTELSTLDLTPVMGLGWNYGNSLEQSIDTSKMTEEEKASVDVAYCETSANNVAITQKNVDYLKKYGFNNVRIPVAWSNLMDISEDGMTYTINEDYMNRVEEVMNYCLNNEMYVIVNIHYDGDWWGQFGDADENVRKMAWARYEQIWTQLAARYEEYSDRLILESANEELGDRLNDDWVNRSTANKTGVLTVEEQYETLNAINQKFVDIVRASGGNNQYRHLLIAGYSTNIDATCNAQFKMPQDTPENGVSKLSVSVHYYTPWNYCGGNEYHQGEGMAPRLYDWGTEEDLAEMHGYLDKMKQFTEAGYGVIIGEYGVQSTAAAGIPDYIGKVAAYALENKMVPVLWDNGTWFNREKNYINYDNVADAILEVTGADGSELEKSGNDTKMPMYRELGSDSELTLLYTWEGEWLKNGGGNANETSYIKPSISSTTEDGWTFHCNTYGYWAVIHSEALQDIKQPYIRVTCQDDEIDSANLQISGAEFKEKYSVEEYGLYEEDEAWGVETKGALEKCSPSGTETDIAPEEEWSGKIYAIDPEITSYPIIWLSASNKPVFTKIEIFDGPEIDWGE